jgi:hypothetical protein
MRVLIVDDHALFAESVQLALRERGIEDVDVVSDALRGNRSLLTFPIFVCLPSQQSPMSPLCERPFEWASVVF